MENPIVRTKKINEDDHQVVYAFGYEGNMTGRIRLRKDLDPDSDLPEQIKPVDSKNPDIYFRLVITRLARYFFKNEYPDEDMIVPGY